MVRWLNHTGCQATDGFLPHWLTHIQPSCGLKNGHLWWKRDSNGALKQTLYSPTGHQAAIFFPDTVTLHHCSRAQQRLLPRLHRSLLNVAPLTTVPPLCCTDILSVSCLYTWNNPWKQQLSRDLAVEMLQNCNFELHIPDSVFGWHRCPCVALDFQKENVMLLYEGNSSNSNSQSRRKVDAVIAEKTKNFL